MHFLIDEYTLKRQRLKRTQLKKVRFIKVNELKITQVILAFFYFMCVTANASELFCMAYLAVIERFYAILTFHFEYQVFYICKLTSLS